VQLAAPEHMRGRLTAFYLFAFAGLAPIGGLVAGGLAEVGGTGLAFGLAGAVGLAALALANTQRASLERGVVPLSASADSAGT
jgi:hypothetical protein